MQLLRAMEHYYAREKSRIQGLISGNAANGGVN